MRPIKFRAWSKLHKMFKLRHWIDFDASVIDLMNELTECKKKIRKGREFLISLSKEPISSGGNGGSAFVTGKNGIAIGGSGGSGNNADMIRKILKYLEENP